ncbi:MAG: type IV secretion system protein [Rickettsiaceae bacterium]|nr:type IV secretion system protein [Rickettsiaceae bacterium]
MKSASKILLVIITIIQAFIPKAYGDDNVFDWMNADIMSFTPSPRCIEVPKFSSVNQSNKNLNVAEPNKWVPAGVHVDQNKMLSMTWNTKGVSPRPQKYRVLYRIDPRFSQPQIFIQKYDYVQQKYITDFNNYRSQILPFYQQNYIFSTTRFDDFNDYFNFVGRQKIPVQKNDVVNITLDANGNFFGSDGDMQGGLGNDGNPISIFTDSSSAVLRNKVMYASANKWCSDIITTATPDYTTRCLAVPGKYLNLGDQIPQLVGKISDSYFTSKINSIPSCPDNADGADNPVCFYDKGRGFKVDIGGVTIKDYKQKFIYSPFSGKYFLYHYSDSAGDLNFTTPWPITGMYGNGFLQQMLQWKTFATSIDVINYINLLLYLNANSLTPVNFFHFGGYTMEIEIGQASAVISPEDLSNIRVDYYIAETGSPDNNTIGNIVTQDFKGNAPTSGWLWLKVSGVSNLAGNINVNIANYTGSTWFSSVVYGDLVSPLRDKYNELSRIIYEKLVSNPTLQAIAKSCLVIYIIIYGLAFLAGAVQITVTDIVIRVLKVGVIVALFSETSWSFFNDNLFKVFVSGSDYLLTTVVGVTSTVGNVFGFIDPIFDKYGNGDIWALLAIQLLQIHNGLAFFACLAIYSMLIYLRAVLEVIITYCLAFLGLAVMISLAPFFIILILFEQTKSLFDNWLSTLFSYMLQPTVLLVFFLLIDQLMGEYITEVVVKACWGILIPLKISIDLRSMDIPISFSFYLPFLSGIPFYIPVVSDMNSIDDFFNAKGTFVRVATSGFIFFIYCKLSAGLIDYITLITNSLTGVTPARQEGELQDVKSANPVHNIMGDIKKATSPVTSVPRKVASFAKEKFIDQKITHREKDKVGDPDYSGIKKNSSSGDSEGDIDGNSPKSEISGGKKPEKENE